MASSGGDEDLTHTSEPIDSPVQSKGSEVRQLTSDEIAKLAKDKTFVSEFKQAKLEKEAQKNWDLFYKRNTTKFFKDRHWTTREFGELCGKKEGEHKQVVLEVGCGENVNYNEERCRAFQCDLTKDSLTDNVPACSVDIVTMIFVLSAIHPEQMHKAIANVHSVLKPGGCVLVRDYGLYDHAMLRFAPGHKLCEHFYVRQDGTRAYYFTKEELGDLFKNAGFTVDKNDYILRETVNKKEGLCVPRVFVQAKYVKTEHDQHQIWENSRKDCDKTAFGINGISSVTEPLEQEDSKL